MPLGAAPKTGKYVHNILILPLGWPGLKYLVSGSVKGSLDPPPIPSFSLFPLASPAPTACVYTCDKDEWLLHIRVLGPRGQSQETSIHAGLIAL